MLVKYVNTQYIFLNSKTIAYAKRLVRTVCVCILILSAPTSKRENVVIFLEQTKQFSNNNALVIPTLPSVKHCIRGETLKDVWMCVIKHKYCHEEQFILFDPVKRF